MERYLVCDVHGILLEQGLGPARTYIVAAHSGGGWRCRKCMTWEIPPESAERILARQTYWPGVRVEDQTPHTCITCGEPTRRGQMYCFQDDPHSYNPPTPATPLLTWRPRP